MSTGVDAQKALEAADVAFKKAVAARETAEGRLADLVRTVSEKEAVLDGLRRETDAAHKENRGAGALDRLRARRRDLRLDIEELRAELGDGEGPVGLRRVVEKVKLDEFRNGMALAQAKRALLAEHATGIARQALDALDTLKPLVSRLEELQSADQQERGTADGYRRLIQGTTGESEGEAAIHGPHLLVRAGLDRAFFDGVLKPIPAEVARLRSRRPRPE